MTPVGNREFPLVPCRSLIAFPPPRQMEILGQLGRRSCSQRDKNKVMNNFQRVPLVLCSCLEVCHVPGPCRARTSHNHPRKDTDATPFGQARWQGPDVGLMVEFSVLSCHLLPGTLFMALGTPWEAWGHLLVEPQPSK